ncbi:MAG: hypothetical protein QW689_07265 [Nitrososphaerota archaeon]
MPRINLRTLWFEDISFARQGMIDTPFGRMSARQLAGLGFFALLAWIAFQALSFVGDLVFQLIPAGLVFLAGAILFTWPVKTVPPERIILLALGIGRRPLKKAPAKSKAERVAEKGAPVPREAAPTARVSKAQATVGEPFKIVGVLRDPRLGKPLANCGFEVFADGVFQYKGSTDEQGGFEVVYVPQYAGVLNIEVRPEGVVGAEQKVEVTVRGVSGEGLR